MTAPAHQIEPEEVMAYVDGELAPDRTTAVSDHLRDCAACRELCDDLRATSGRLATWQVAPAPATLGRPVAVPPTRARLRPGGFLAAARHMAVVAAQRPVWSFAVAPLLIVAVAVALFAPVARKRATVFAPASESTGLKVMPGRSAPLPAAAVVGRSQIPPGVPRQTGPRPQTLVARTAYINVLVDDFDPARQALDRLVRDHRGYAAHLEITGERQSGRRLTATLRVPASDLDQVLTQLKALGRVQQESQTVEDVLTQVTDLDARLSNARSAETRLVEILRQRAGRIADVLAVEQEMTRVRGEIEQMEAERRNLALRVDMATVQLEISEQGKATVDFGALTAGASLRNAAVEGYQTLLETALGFVLFLVREGPRLIFWGIVLLAIGWGVKVGWRRSRPAR